MDTKQYKIGYIGLHPNTLRALGGGKNFRVEAVSFLDYLLNFRTANPINLIFKLVYYFRVKNKFRWLEKFFLKIFIWLSPLSSSLAKRYKDYLVDLSENAYLVFNAEKEDLTISFLEDKKIDLLVVNSWGMLSEKIIEKPRFGTLNIHPSKLPQHKGALPTLWSLKNNDKISAVTYIILDKTVDGGDIVGQYLFDISSEDNYLSLENRIEKIIFQTLVSDIEAYLSGSVVPKKQDSSAESFTGKYYEYRKIDWVTEKAKDIYNKVNLYPFLEPGLYCYFYIGKKRVKIKKMVFCPNITDVLVGGFKIKFFKMYFRTNDGFLMARLFCDIKWSDSFLIILSK